MYLISRFIKTIKVTDNYFTTLDVCMCGIMHVLKNVLLQLVMRKQTIFQE